MGITVIESAFQTMALLLTGMGICFFLGTKQRSAGALICAILLLILTIGYVIFAVWYLKYLR